MPKIFNGLVNDFDFRFHAGRSEKARDLGRVLLLGEAGVERREGV